MPLPSVELALNAIAWPVVADVGLAPAVIVGPVRSTWIVSHEIADRFAKFANADANWLCRLTSFEFDGGLSGTALSATEEHQRAWPSLVAGRMHVVSVDDEQSDW